MVYCLCLAVSTFDNAWCCLRLAVSTFDKHDVTDCRKDPVNRKCYILYWRQDRVSCLGVDREVRIAWVHEKSFNGR